MDDMIAKNAGRAPGKTPTVAQSEKELGRPADEPEDADVSEHRSSNEDEAIESVGTEEDGEQAGYQQHAESNEETAAPEPIQFDDSEEAGVVRGSEDDSPAAEAIPGNEDDSPGADISILEESDEGPAAPQHGLSADGEFAAIEQMFADDSTTEVEVSRGSATSMIEVMPAQYGEEIRNVLDNSLNHAGEISFSSDESDTPLPDFADLGHPENSMTETDQALSDLPFIALFSGRKRDQ